MYTNDLPKRKDVTYSGRICSGGRSRRDIFRPNMFRYVTSARSPAAVKPAPGTASWSRREDRGLAAKAWSAVRASRSVNASRLDVQGCTGARFALPSSQPPCAYRIL